MKTPLLPAIGAARDRLVERRGAVPRERTDLVGGSVVQLDDDRLVHRRRSTLEIDVPDLRELHVRADAALSPELEAT